MVKTVVVVVAVAGVVDLIVETSLEHIVGYLPMLGMVVFVAIVDVDSTVALVVGLAVVLAVVVVVTVNVDLTVEINFVIVHNCP